MEKRLTYIDSAKGIAIFLMVFAHISTVNLDFKQWICSFHMPFFFFVYGFQLDEKKLKSFGGIDNKIKTYLVPYFIWALIYRRNFSFSSCGAILYGTYESIRAYSQGYLWFLPCMFLAVIIYRFIMTKIPVRNGWYLASLSIACSIVAGVLDYTPTLEKGLPWGCNIAIGGVGIMILGRIYRLILERIHSKKWIIIAIIIVCASLSFTYKVNAGILNSELRMVSMANAAYGNYLLYLLTAISQIILLINLCMFIDNRMLQFIGKNTMIVYMMQGMLFAIYLEVVALPISNKDLDGFIMSVFTLVISLLLGKIINRYCPWLVRKAN